MYLQSSLALTYGVTKIVGVNKSENAMTCKYIGRASGTTDFLRGGSAGVPPAVHGNTQGIGVYANGEVRTSY